MPNCAKVLYAVELDVSQEAGYEYWIIHQDDPEDEHTLCVYGTEKEAQASAKMRDHNARVVKFIRETVISDD